MDAAYNVSGSMTAMDQLLEINTNDKYPPILYGNNIESVHFDGTPNSYYVQENKLTQPIYEGTILVHFIAPSIPSGLRGVFNLGGQYDQSYQGVFVFCGSSVGGIYGGVYDYIEGNAWNFPTTPNAEYVIGIAYRNHTPGGERPITTFFINGEFRAKWHVARLTYIPYYYIGCLYPEYGSPYIGNILSARHFDYALSDEEIIDFSNFKDKDRPNIWMGSKAPVAEFVYSKVQKDRWINTGKLGGSAILQGEGIEVVYGDDLFIPESNQMETYTPNLYPGQILDTKGVPIYNLEATQGREFNSSIMDSDGVASELEALEKTLTEVDKTPYLTTEGGGNYIETEKQFKIIADGIY